MGTGTPEEWTKTTSCPNIVFRSSGPLGTSVGIPLIKTVMIPATQQKGLVNYVNEFNFLIGLT